MLKPQPTLNLIADTKCGEIFFNSLKKFTIFCTFCQMKSFQLEDFFLHVQNVHLRNDLENTLSISSQSEEFKNYCLEVNLNHETISDETPIVLWDNIEQSLSKNSQRNETSLFEEENGLFNNTDRSLSIYSDDDDSVGWEDQIKLNVLNKHERKKECTSSEEFENEQCESLKDVTEALLYFKKSKGTKYNCNDCNEKFLHKKHLDVHVRDLHSGYKCSLCDKRFNRTTHVECHLKTHMTERKFKCSIKDCRKEFIDEEYLKRHLEVHTLERTFICKYENCGKAFQTQRRLASHEYYHTKEKKFVCDMCGYSCHSNPQLKTHQRVHTGEKPFPCEVCNKLFISKKALQEHMISHSQVRPHVCPICGRGFANPRVLVRHKFVHSDEKTFKCNLCKSAFRHPNSLQGHIRFVHRLKRK